MYDYRVQTLHTSTYHYDTLQYVERSGKWRLYSGKKTANVFNYRTFLLLKLKNCTVLGTVVTVEAT
jgi:hypothetical protein